MKMKFFKCMIVCSGLIASFYLFQSKEEEITDLALQNVEALASEEGDRLYFCYRPGSIDCCGNKVEYKFVGVR